MADTLSRAEVAKRAGISVRQLTRWRQLGYVPQPIARPGVPRWRKQDIIRWVRRMARPVVVPRSLYE